MTDTLEITDYWQFEELARERGWTDGLPLAPPTEERVEAILEHVGRAPGETIGRVPPAGGEGTIEQIAIQCAMAGCLPEHVPVVLAALEAMMEDEFNLRGVQCTTNACAPLCIVTGPIAAELGVNSRHGCFGGGAHANAAIGRAIRLVLWNIGGGRPGINDMTPLGHPGKYSFCVAENHEESPWPGLQSDFGIEDGRNAVVVFACQPPYPAVLSGTHTQILDMLAESMPSTTINQYHAAGQFMVVLSPNVARELGRHMDKTQLREWLFENARYSVKRLREDGLLEGQRDPVNIYWGEAGLADVQPDLFSLADDVKLPMVQSPDDFHILVAGGAAQWWGGFCPGWGAYGGFARAKALD
jgi:hypothetical protein